MNQFLQLQQTRGTYLEFLFEPWTGNLDETHPFLQFLDIIKKRSKEGPISKWRVNFISNIFFVLRVHINERIINRFN